MILKIVTGKKTEWRTVTRFTYDRQINMLEAWCTHDPEEESDLYALEDFDTMDLLSDSGKILAGMPYDPSVK